MKKSLSCRGAYDYDLARRVCDEVSTLWSNYASGFDPKFSMWEMLQPQNHVFFYLGTCTLRSRDRALDVKVEIAQQKVYTPRFEVTAAALKWHW